MAFDQTKQSSQDLKQTIGTSQSWDNSGIWGVQVNNISNPFTGTGDALINVANTAVSGLSNTGAAIHKTFTDGAQYEAVADSAASAAIDYLEQKISRIKNAWTTQSEITVAALLEEIAPYAMDWTSAISKLNSKVSNVLEYILGVNGLGSWEDLGLNLSNDVISSILNDPSLQSSASQLGAVQTVANGVNAIVNVVNAIKKVMNVLEPAFPFLEIASNLAVAFWGGGVPVAEATSKSSQLVQQECQKLISLSMQALRKYLYNIKIKVPAIVVGALESISVREAMVGSSGNDWIDSIFSEQFYEDTQNSLIWQKSISEALNNTINWAESSVDTVINNMVGNSNGTWGENMKAKFLSSLTVSFMSNAVAQARRESFMPDPIENADWFTQEGIKDIFGKIGENADNAFETVNSQLSELDKVLADDSEENPISDADSIRLITGNIYRGL